MNDNNQKIIIKYYKLLKISIPCLIMSLLIGGVWLFLEMIHGIAFNSSKSSVFTTGLFVYLGIVAINLFMFAYSVLRVRFGISGKKWKEMISTSQNINSDVNYHGEEAAVAIGTLAAGRLMTNSDNNTIAGVGKGVEVLGAIQTVNVASNQVGSMMSHIIDVAKQFNVKLPSMKNWFIFIIVFPIIIFNVAYIPVFIESNKYKQEEIAKIQEIEKQISTSLETYFNRVSAHDPAQSIMDSYDITAYMENDKNEYVSIDITPEGEVKEISYHSDVLEGESKEASIQSFNEFMKKSSELLYISTDTDLTSINQIPEKAVNEYMEKDGQLFVSDHLEDYNYTFSYKVNSYDDKPYLYFTIKKDY